jgi:hypothetical protein
MAINGQVPRTGVLPVGFSRLGTGYADFDPLVAVLVVESA